MHTRARACVFAVALVMSACANIPLSEPTISPPLPDYDTAQPTPFDIDEPAIGRRPGPGTAVCTIYLPREIHVEQRDRRVRVTIHSQSPELLDDLRARAREIAYRGYTPTDGSAPIPVTAANIRGGVRITVAARDHEEARYLLHQITDDHSLLMPGRC